MTEPQWQVFAIRYGTMETTRSDQFYRYGAFGDPDGPITLDYYFWVLQSDRETILVDSGFHPDAIRHRPGRKCLIPPVEALRLFGVDHDQVSRVIVTHFHYDHIGNLAAFPNATFVVHQAEMDFWTGPYAGVPAVAASVEPAEIAFLQEARDQGRVQLLTGNSGVAPGISTIHVGGHCPGQLIVTVEGSRPLMLCSDAVHFMEEVDRFMPFGVFFDLEGMFDTYDLVRRARAEGTTAVPGHDPSVIEDFSPAPQAPGIAVQLSAGVVRR